MEPHVTTAYVLISWCLTTCSNVSMWNLGFWRERHEDYHLLG